MEGFSRDRGATPSWTAFVHVREGEQDELERILGEVRSQSLPPARIVIVDATLDGLAEKERAGAAVLRERSPSRGLAWRRAASASDAAWVALFAPRSSYRLDRVERQLATLAASPGSRLATSDLEVARDAGTPFRIAQDLNPDPAGAFEDSLVLHREAARAIDPACFAPAELGILRAQRASGSAVHVPLALHRVCEPEFRRAAERTREDGELLALGHLPHARAIQSDPEVTVLMATHERRDVLLECLEGFSRQLLPAGTLEIVVVDDASNDGTAELGAALDLPVRLHFAHRSTPGGATQARIHGLPHARGRLVLFVNDDTIPFPDTVRRHIEAHRELAEDKAIVLGTFEQPEEHRSLSLTRLLDESSYIFDYASWQAGDIVPGTAFFTCNLSVARSAVLEVGGFDPRFTMYAEDTDLGIRLEKAGYRMYYRPECRSIHRHLFDFEMLRRRQPLVAKAHVKLFEKHRERLNGSKWVELGSRGLAGVLDSTAGVLGTIEEAARGLSTIHLDTVARAGGSLSALSERVSVRLAELVARLNTVWWYQGFREGFVEHGGLDFPSIATDWGSDPPEEGSTVDIVRANDAAWPEEVQSWIESQLSRGEDDARSLFLIAETANPDEIDTVRALFGRMLRRARRNGLAARVYLGAADAANASPVPSGPSIADLRLLAWPDWNDGDGLARLAACVAPLLDHPHAQVLLLHPEPGGAHARAELADFRRALESHGPGSRLPTCTLLAPPADPSGWMELRATLDLATFDPALNSPNDLVLRELELPHVHTAAELAAELLDREGTCLPPICGAAPEELLHA
ncbi:MAG TPA: glycosyltransferase family 2 protein [Planctomycetes bacterium]|nr:glycosyltransferase family 2 protein [Planctomycetota bacterium]